jgi:hypothetical protein
MYNVCPEVNEYKPVFIDDIIALKENYKKS